MFLQLLKIPCILLRGIDVPEPAERVVPTVGDKVFTRRFAIADAILEGKPSEDG